MSDVIEFCKSKTEFVVKKVRPVFLANKERLSPFDLLDFDLFTDPERYYPKAYLDSINLSVDDVKIRYIKFLKSMYKLKHGN